MCILCVVQKWSRRVATMLPWLVIPLIGFWALSQLLPPGFRFEVTSPRLACVLVLLVTLFWYEVLMPQLSAWRARRSARLRERRRFEAIELQKLRKTATRRCRNCHTPYRDQNPGGGRFMCSYCGHVSKRPVLDIPGPSMLGIENSGIGKIWNGKVWLENGWICGQDWSENGNWAPSFGGKSNYAGKNGTNFFGGDDRCSAEKSYSGVVIFFRKLLSSFFLSLRWLMRKVFRISSTGDDGSDAENKGGSKKGENGANFHESRGEKARRKAEEKRQARLERELLEEEERKQREEVARLVEERRRLRDEQMEAEKERDKSSNPDQERGNRREVEKRRQEKKKEKDRGSSKSNSDVEDFEKKSTKESERKREFDKRSETERRVPNSDIGHATKGTMNTSGRVSGCSSRYFDRMTGTFLSSSKAFNGAGFFGRASYNSANAVNKANKPTGFGDNVQSFVGKREVHSAERANAKVTSSGDDKNTQIVPPRLVGSDHQPRPTVQKKSWQQLFTGSSTTEFHDANTTVSQQSQNRPSPQSIQQHDQAPLSYHLDKQSHYGVPPPYVNSPLSTGSLNSSSVSPVAEPMFPHVGGSANVFVSEEAELFEDPCYVPDPVALLGPVSESLDNFPLDLGTGFITNTVSERPHILKNVSGAADLNRPAPIESPLSRLRVSEEKHVNSGQPQSTPKSRDQQVSPRDESNNASHHGTWQMWGTPPLVQDGLGLTGGPASWFMPLGQNKPNQVAALHPSSNEAMKSQFAVENQVIHGHDTCSPQKIRGCLNGEIVRPIVPALGDNDPWLHKSVFQPLPGDGENPFPPLSIQKGPVQNEVTFESPSKSAAGHLFEPPQTNCWSKGNFSVAGESKGNLGNTSTIATPHIGGLFSNPDVQSLWSFN